MFMIQTVSKNTMTRDTSAMSFWRWVLSVQNMPGTLDQVKTNRIASAFMGQAYIATLTPEERTSEKWTHLISDQGHFYLKMLQQSMPEGKSKGAELVVIELKAAHPEFHMRPPAEITVANYPENAATGWVAGGTAAVIAANTVLYHDSFRSI
jgi:hypothetical protein